MKKHYLLSQFKIFKIYIMQLLKEVIFNQDARFDKRNMNQFFFLFNYLAYFANQQSGLQQKIFALQNISHLI